MSQGQPPDEQDASGVRGVLGRAASLPQKRSQQKKYRWLYSSHRLSQRQQTLVRIAARGTGFGQGGTAVVAAQGSKEICLLAPVDDLGGEALVGGRIDGFEGQPGEGGIGIEAGQEGR